MGSSRAGSNPARSESFYCNHLAHKPGTHHSGWKLACLSFTLGLSVSSMPIGSEVGYQNGHLFPPGLEPGTFRVLGERDNHYTTETACFK